MVYSKSLIISKNKTLKKEGFDEENLPAKQYQTEENPWFSGEDVHPEWPECPQAQKSQREEKADRLVRESFRFAKKERIALPQDFKRVMKSGRRLTTKNFILFLRENERGYHRLGIVAKKEIGPASLRNRMKRYLREFFRLHKHQVKGPFDMIILIKKGIVLNRYGEAEEELKRVLI
jgi:ribonuclease P protein component